MDAVIDINIECPRCGGWLRRKSADLCMSRNPQWLECDNDLCEERGVRYERVRVEIVPYVGVG